VPASPAALAGEVVRLVAARGETFATAESLTGGLVAATVVEIPGVSAVFRGGLVVYATDLKHALAGVPEDLLAARGPVDPDVALALAAGARRRCVADWGLATTGVAGPDPQDGIAPGTVYVAVDGPSGGEVLGLRLTGDRATIRTESVTRVLSLFAQRIAAAPARA
jgi:nicotinamide-nucleotide amidase